MCGPSSVQSIDGSKVELVDGSILEPDQLIFSTGYKIDLPYLSQDIKDSFLNEQSNDIKVNLHNTLFKFNYDSFLYLVKMVVLKLVRIDYGTSDVVQV